MVVDFKKCSFSGVKFPICRLIMIGPKAQESALDTAGLHREQKIEKLKSKTKTVQEKERSY